MTDRAEFAQVRENGKSRPGRYLVVSVLRDDALSHFKIGLIVTKKVGKAHERNLLRRRFRAIIQKYGEQLKPDRRIVTIARWRAVEASYEELERDWLKQARHFGLFKEERQG